MSVLRQLRVAGDRCRQKKHCQNENFRGKITQPEVKNTHKYS
jgi:hypothetical protein